MEGRQPNCLICEIPITDCHLGINCCRECAVFYKRTFSMKRTLTCKGGDDECMTRDPTTSCRKCRYARFSEVLASCYGEDLEKVDITNERANLETDSNVSTSQTFIDYETIMLNEPSCSETSILERMKRAYGILCLTRKNGELGTSSPEVLSQLLKGSIKFAPATYKIVIPNAMILYGGLIEFSKMAFDDFRNMTSEIQHIIMKRNFDFMGKIIDLHRSVHHFPHEDETVLTSFTTYFTLKDSEAFFVDGLPEINKEEASREIAKNFKRTLAVNKAHFKRVQPTNEEFLALLGLALWNENTVENDEQMMEIVKRNRSSILNELHKHYAKKGTTDYASRLGELLCLLVNVENVSSLMEEDSKLYSLMNIFNEFNCFISDMTA